MHIYMLELNQPNDSLKEHFVSGADGKKGHMTGPAGSDATRMSEEVIERWNMQVFLCFVFS